MVGILLGSTSIMNKVERGRRSRGEKAIKEQGTHQKSYFVTKPKAQRPAGKPKGGAVKKNEGDNNQRWRNGREKKQWKRRQRETRVIRS